MFPKTQGCENSQNSIQKRQFANGSAKGINCCQWVNWVSIFGHSIFFVVHTFIYLPKIASPMSLLIFLMNKKRPYFFCIKTSSFIHFFFSSFSVCLLATCSLLSAIMYVRRTYVLPTCLHFFADLCRDM